MTGLNIGLAGFRPIRRSIFISYHHDGDQAYKRYISDVFAEQYGVVEDNSLERAFDSDNAEYVMSRIREKHITGTSCTLVLCGTETPYRKYVDWEIKATLDRQHGLVGVWLPTLYQGAGGGTAKPARLQDNIDSGYAVWCTWTDLVSSAAHFTNIVNEAIQKAPRLIVNTRELRVRNG